MRDVHCEIRRDAEFCRLWGLEVVDHEITGCVGPFREGTVSPSWFETVAFERNPELLWWLRGRHLQQIPHPPRASWTRASATN
jgi:hypothetical protein